MKKLSNSETELEKSVAYEKSVHSLTKICYETEKLFSSNLLGSICKYLISVKQDT